MIKTIRASKSEKILFIFLICLSIFAFTSFFLLKNKCLFVEKNNFHSGILNLTSLHTSCSLTINENADPNVLRDLKKYMQSIVPYDSYLTLSKNREEISYKHYQEGADDMPAHIKTSLTNTCLSLSFQDGKIMLGTWQAVYLWEHRFDQKERIINVHIIGEKK